MKYPEGHPPDIFFIYKVWCDVFSHYRHKFKFEIFFDLRVYSTDVYFNKYLRYDISCTNLMSSLYLMDRRIINLLSSFLIRNIGFDTVKINNAVQHFLTDVEKYQRHCIFWGNRNSFPFYFRYTSDRNVVINYYDDNAWWNLKSNDMELVIHGVTFKMFGRNKVRIYMSPHLDIVFHQ